MDVKSRNYYNRIGYKFIKKVKMKKHIALLVNGGILIFKYIRHPFTWYFYQVKKCHKNRTKFYNREQREGGDRKKKAFINNGKE